VEILFVLFRIVILCSLLRRIDWGFGTGQLLEAEHNPGLLVSSKLMLSSRGMIGMSEKRREARRRVDGGGRGTMNPLPGPDYGGFRHL